MYPFQVDMIQENISDLGIEVAEVDENVDFLFAEQVIQDERLLNLEIRALVVENDVEGREAAEIQFSEIIKLQFKKLHKIIYTSVPVFPIF